MILRRLVVSLVLIMFAAVSFGVIVGLDDAARSEIVRRLPDAVTASPAVEVTSSPTPEPTPRPTQTPTPMAIPTPTATATPTPTITPQAGPTVKPAPTKKAPVPQKKAPAVKQQPKPPRATKPLAVTKGVVYLTFDDGPSPYTASVLDILRRTGSTATFFQLGANRPGYDGVIHAITAQGSNIGNHSYDHPDLTKQKPEQLRWQIANGPRAACFRPPFGATNTDVRKAIARSGAQEVLWSDDTFDWKKPGVKKLKKFGQRASIRSGSVILMHDGGGDRRQTVAALPTIITELQARGYRLRALPSCG